MELIPILSTVVLVMTASTCVLAVAAYVLYKIREHKARRLKAAAAPHEAPGAEQPEETHLLVAPEGGSHAFPPAEALWALLDTRSQADPLGPALVPPGRRAQGEAAPVPSRPAAAERQARRAAHPLAGYPAAAPDDYDARAFEPHGRPPADFEYDGARLSPLDTPPRRRRRKPSGRAEVPAPGPASGKAAARQRAPLYPAEPAAPAPQPAPLRSTVSYPISAATSSSRTAGERTASGWNTSYTC